MIPRPFRCIAKHPTVPGWECRGKLTVAIEGTVTIEPGDQPGPGCVVLHCNRKGCGAKYVACPVTEQKGAA